MRAGHPVHGQLQALRDTFTLGMLVGDAKLCASVYARDGVIVPPDGQARRGAEEIRAFWQHVIDSGGRGDSVICESIRAPDRLAVEEGVYARFADPVALGPPLARGTYLLIVAPQEDGTWAWTADLWTDTTACGQLLDPQVRLPAAGVRPVIGAPEGMGGEEARVEDLVVDGRRTLALHGEFDLATLPMVRAALVRAAAEPDGDLLVDFHAVTFCGADLLGLLAAAAARLRAHGFRLRVRRIRAAEARLFRLCGLEDLLDRG